VQKWEELRLMLILLGNMIWAIGRGIEAYCRFGTWGTTKLLDKANLIAGALCVLGIPLAAWHTVDLYIDWQRTKRNNDIKE
jgi:hypothetical protein